MILASLSQFKLMLRILREINVICGCPLDSTLFTWIMQLCDAINQFKCKTLEIRCSVSGINKNLWPMVAQRLYNMSSSVVCESLLSTSPAIHPAVYYRINWCQPQCCQPPYSHSCIVCSIYLVVSWPIITCLSSSTESVWAHVSMLEWDYHCNVLCFDAINLDY